MWRKGWMMKVFVVVAMLALLWTPAYAAEASEATPGDSPQMPLGPVSEWTELAPGAMRWHAFYYAHPHAMRSGETVEATPVNVRLEFSPKEAGKFEILTQEQVNLWAKAEKYTPVGQGTLACGCKPEDNPRKLSWSGIPIGHSMYYILVKNPTEKPLNYRLFIDENKYVQYPAPIVMQAAAQAAVAPAAAGAAAVVAPASTETVAAPKTGEWFTLKPGDVKWFNFAYDPDRGSKRDKDPASVFLTLFVERDHPLNSVYFDVFTDQEYQELIKNGEDITGADALKGTAVGCGTENGTAIGEFTWLGQFMDAQTLHVRVRLAPNCGTDLNVKLEAVGKTIQQM